MPAGKEPSLALADIVLIGAKVLVDRGHPRSTLEHARPLALLAPMQLSDCTGLKPHVDAGKLVATGSSRIVVCRAQPPGCNRLWLSAKDHFRLGSVPWSVNGGDSLLGLWDSRAGFVGPISVAPFWPRIG